MEDKMPEEQTTLEEFDEEMEKEKEDEEEADR